MSFDDPEYQRYLDELKARADMRTPLQDPRPRRGFAKGEEKGEARGVILGKIEFAQYLLGDPATSRDELLKRPPADLAALAKSLEERLRSRPAT